MPLTFLQEHRYEDEYYDDDNGYEMSQGEVYPNVQVASTEGEFSHVEEADLRHSNLCNPLTSAFPQSQRSPTMGFGCCQPPPNIPARLLLEFKRHWFEALNLSRSLASKLSMAMASPCPPTLLLRGPGAAT
jgi:hypothetical protein